MSTPPLVIVMPCRTEADSIEVVIGQLKKLKPDGIYIGLDPATTDDTRAVAEKGGAVVVVSPRSGYDPVVDVATTRAIADHPTSYILYTDAGGKYGYDKVPEMIESARKGSDMVLGVRTDAAGTMLWHQKLGTRMVLLMINLLLGKRIRDISPFRLVRSSVFERVVMDPQKYRWPSELLVKSLSAGLVVDQIDVVSLPRIGTSKVSASLRNSLRAGIEMVSSTKFVRYNYTKRKVASCVEYR
jgi:hypothetical protein